MLKKLLKKSPTHNLVYPPLMNLKSMARLFPQSASLQNLPGEFRGAIGSNYHDLDMKNNRRLSILLQYCQMT